MGLCQRKWRYRRLCVDYCLAIPSVTVANLMCQTIPFSVKWQYLNIVRNNSLNLKLDSIIIYRIHYWDSSSWGLFERKGETTSVDLR